MFRVLLLAVAALVGPVAAADRPNILWLTCEDMSPNLGCWGDGYARSPHIDRLASQGVRYTSAFATNPICSPTRSCLITGVYATSLGSQNLRSNFPTPESITGFPAYLRRAGYYTTNNVKTDYNTSREPAIIEASWDECSAKAHWRNRKPGQPFFAVFNNMLTHQGPTTVMPYERFQKEIQWQLAPDERHDPASAPLPPYYPDTPITRRTIARYYDCITAMDKQVGQLLDELDVAGLADDTIVFFYSDHGAGMPRHKRLVLDSGMHVPLVIRFPEKYRHLAPAPPGSAVDRLVSFVDFAPTVLSLVGLPIPDYMQGVAFLGAAAGPPRQYVFGARDRVDEAYDLTRSVRDARYLYVRNYMPHLSYNQPEGYSDQAEVRREITRLAAEGQLDAVQMAYAGPRKAMEELYDTQADPHQINNLAASPEHREALERLRAAQRQWRGETRDLGFLPEYEIDLRSAGSTPYEMARRVAPYPQDRIAAAAELVGRPDATLEQLALLEDADAAVRYWAVVGLRASGDTSDTIVERIAALVQDRSASVRIEAAGALAESGDQPAIGVLAAELRASDPHTAIHAARTLQLLGPKAGPALEAMQAVRADAPLSRDSNTALYLGFALDPVIELFKPKTAPAR